MTVADIIKAASVPLGMLIIGGLTYAALKAGIDGSVFMSGCALIGGLGGFYLKGLITRK